MKISGKAASITPYLAGEQPHDKRYVKLNTNENPYPPSPLCAAALKGVDPDVLKLYPDPTAAALRKAIAGKEGVGIGNVFIGNGSDEVLAIALRAFYDSFAAPVKFPAVSYSFYPVYCDLFDIKYEAVANEPDFSVDVLKLTGGQGALLTNPNAPTTLSQPLSDVEKLLKNMAGKAVIVDEAYVDFARRTSTAVPLVKKYENLAVVKTFSKSYSLAGIRCGYMIAPPPLINAAERIRDSFNSYTVDTVCQAVCAAAIKDEAYHKLCVDKVVATRSRVIAALSERGRRVLDSDANFLFVEGGFSDYSALRERGVLVRWFDKPLLRGFTRVSVGSDEEMDAYLAALPDLR